MITFHWKPRQNRRGLFISRERYPSLVTIRFQFGIFGIMALLFETGLDHNAHNVELKLFV